jgi:hypothetical protein
MAGLGYQAIRERVVMIEESRLSLKSALTA